VTNRLFVGFVVIALSTAACSPGEQATGAPANTTVTPPTNVAGHTGIAAGAPGFAPSIGMPAALAGSPAVVPMAPASAGLPPRAGSPAQPPAGAAPTIPPAPPPAGPPPPAAPAAPMLGPAQTLPPVTDYSKPGPFAPTMVVNNTGPDGMYTMYRPTTLGANGFKHPPLTWGNGVTTTPAQYPTLLSTVASHGFVVIASNSSSVTSQMMTAGLDWLIAQDAAAGPFQGKLDTTRAVSMGYSLGGGGALTTGAHKNVITTIAMHPAPGGGALHGPVLLYTGTDDTVVAPTLVMSSYSRLQVPAMLATLDGATHFEPVGTGGRELAPSIAWLRLWVFNDEGAKSYFYGDDCKLCVSPWTKQTNPAWK
jgi:hypothetical protein